ncbi:MAG: hydrogenase maturation protease [Mariniphaga sp.]|nr:hydrogenase maturation protease [Mariniphaga sp.]
MGIKNYAEKTLVAGIGNEILMDDSIGPKMCKYLRQKYIYSGIKFAILTVGGLEVLEYISGYKKVIFIDAIKTKGGNPGDVYLFTLANFKETSNLSNLHDASFITALGIGKKVSMEIPEEIYIIAIEIKEDMVFGENLSKELNGKLEEVKKNVNDYFLSLLSPGELRSLKLKIKNNK